MSLYMRIVIYTAAQLSENDAVIQVSIYNTCMSVLLAITFNVNIIIIDPVTHYEI